MPSRNDPCPCGSGQTYKRCCLSADVSPPPALRLVLPANGGDGSAEIASRWEVDLLPVALTMSAVPASRPTVVMVMAEELLLHAEVIPSTPCEPGELAQLLLAAVDRAREVAGRRPVELLVRHESLARELRAARPRRASRVSVSRALPNVDRAIGRYEDEVLGLPRRHGAPRVSRPESWGGWQARPRLLDAVFMASADLYKYSPWMFFTNEDGLTVTTTEGRRWSVVIRGASGGATGVSIHESPDDARDLLDHRELSAGRAMRSLRGAVISMVYENRARQSKEIRRELEDNNWELADESACPVLVPLNTPGGGISREQLTDLITVLDIIPEFIINRLEALRHWSETRQEVRWTDPLWKATIAYGGPWTPAKRSSWTAPATLASSGPAGPNATPGVFYPAGTDLDEKAREHRAIALDFKRWLVDDQTDPGLSIEDAQAHTRVARMFVHFLAYRAAVPVTAVDELDLRRFVYGIYALRQHETEAQANALLESLERFFEYLAEVRGIECPWRAEVLDDQDTFMERWEGCPSQPDLDGNLQAWIDTLAINLRERALLPPAIGRFYRVTHDDDENCPVLDDYTFKSSDDQLIFTEDDPKELERRRRWLVWRNEEIRAGVTEPEALRNRLGARLAAEASREG